MPPVPPVNYSSIVLGIREGPEAQIKHTFIELLNLNYVTSTVAVMLYKKYHDVI